VSYTCRSVAVWVYAWVFVECWQGPTSLRPLPVVDVDCLVQRHTIEYPKYRSVPVIPAKAGIQRWSEKPLDPRLRGGDGTTNWALN